MHQLDKLVAAFALALPIAAFAQTTSPTVKPADQPRSQLEQEQTTKNGQATKYGGPGTDTAPSTGSDTTSGMKHKGMKHGKSNATDATKPGDASTYPAPAKDGTPTK